MSGFDLIEALDRLDEEYIQNARNFQRTAPLWIRWTSLAACICCLLLMGSFSLHHILTRTEEVSPTPEALTSVPESSIEETERMGWQTLASQTGRVLSIPDEYVSNVLVDTPFHRIMEDPPFAANFDSAIFSFYTQHKTEDHLDGWIFTIEALPLHETATDELNQIMVFSQALLGTDAAYAYVLRYPGYPTQYCCDGQSIEALTEYLLLAGDSVEILEGFLSENGITSDGAWKEYYTARVITPVREQLDSGLKQLEYLEFNHDGKQITFYNPINGQLLDDGGSGIIGWLEIMSANDFEALIESTPETNMYDDGWYGRIGQFAFLFAKDSEQYYVLNLPTELQYDPTSADSLNSHMTYEEEALSTLRSIVVLYNLTVNPHWSVKTIKELFADVSFAGLEEVDVGNDDISGYLIIRGIKYRGYCPPCYDEEPDQELGPVIAYWECPGLDVGWQYVAEIQGVDPEKYLLQFYEDGTGVPSWGSGAEILVADDITEIPKWIEDMHELYINRTMPGTYTGPKEGFTILEE